MGSDLPRKPGWEDLGSRTSVGTLGSEGGGLEAGARTS